ncbi:MAG: hypothetical protein GTN39_05535 [Candidatus Aenigmarchaeota archaeon]|nr:hypothetical protein [Candidatus Aenigmarchaeota archaeon]
MKRRKVLIYGGATTASILLSQVLKLYAEDPRIEDLGIIENFNKIYEKVKGRKGKFIEPIDIDGDGAPDKVEFELRENGSVSIEHDPTSGIRLDVGFEIGGSYLGKVYAVFNGGKIKYYKDGKPLCKRQFIKEEDIKKYFDFMLKHYEK